MANGQLALRVLDVYGEPITEPADIFLRNQTLSDTPVLRGSNVSNGILLTGLNVFPHGRYRLEVDALSYRPVSRFVDIPANGQGGATITLPINPKKVVGVQFPPYADLPAEARTLLERSAHVDGLDGKTGEALYAALDAPRKAGFLNLVAKASRTRFPNAADEPRSVLSYIGELSELRADRFFAFVPRTLRTETINSLHVDLFHDVSEALHTPPPGFVRDRSFKTFDPYGNLQLSFFTSTDSRTALDMDIDDAQGFNHIFQVVGNIIDGRTNPYNIQQLLIKMQELDPGYRLLLHDVQATNT